MKRFFLESQMPTQLQIARSGKITDTVKCVAQRENIPAGIINEELAAGRLAIPANKLRLGKNLVPAAIGRKVSVKINANIGVSTLSSSLDDELIKMKTAVELGADAIMDLSTGGDLDHIRQTLLSECPVPFGTVPIYQMIVGRNVEQIDSKTILDVIENILTSGDDFHVYLTSHLMYGTQARIITLSAKKPLAIIYKEIGTLRIRML